MNAQVSAELKAGIRVSPTRSQSLLVVLLIVGALALIGSFILLVCSIPQWWMFFTLAITLFGISILGWFKSQSDSDLEGAEPTVVQLPDGTSFTADPRLLLSKDGVNNLASALKMLLSRKPLPKPSGYVDAKNQLIENTEKQAIADIEALNQKTLMATNALVDSLGIAQTSPQNLPEVMDTVPMSAALQTNNVKPSI